MLKRVAPVLIGTILIGGGLTSAVVVHASDTSTPPSTTPATPTPVPVRAHNNIEFGGIVQAMPAPAPSTSTSTPSSTTLIGMWKIQGLSVNVTADTRVNGNPQVGDIVRVGGTLDENGVVTAKHINKVDQKVKITGTITALPTGGVIGTWTVDGRQVQVVQATHLSGKPEIGATAKVEGVLNADGTITARNVQVRPQKPAHPEQAKGPKNGHENNGKAKGHENDHGQDD